MATGELAGCHVVITRPRHQAAALAQGIEQRGGGTRLVPVLQILPAEDAAAARRTFHQLANYHLCIFISRNAVEHGLALLPAHQPWPGETAVAAVGHSTARALRDRGITVAITPEHEYSTEGLLAHPQLQALSGQRILIVRGVGGREVLASQLRARGAQVDYVEVYRRALPEVDVAPLVTDLRQHVVDFIVVTSSEGLQNLFTLLGPAQAPLLYSAVFVVLSERTAQTARDMGIEPKPLVAAPASDDGIIATLIEAWSRRT